jgi:hypothetical protein
MTVLTMGDVRGFYEELGVELPGWSEREAPVRCFAAPESHNRADRSPSTSVNLSNGAWYCHGCGACGGAYDAALSLGHSPRSAIELMISYGLIEPRTGNRTARAARQVAPQRSAPDARGQRKAPAQLGASEAEISRWESSLSRRPSLLAQLAVERGWRYGVMRHLQLGLDSSGRVTIPIRNGRGELRGVLRYQPVHSHGPKMLAVRGTRLGLIPHPAGEPSDHLLVVEGPADMVAARSHGLPAIAVPGAHAWRPGWAELLDGRKVTVVMDCDDPGRAAATRIEHDLARRCNVAVVDLDPGREDGFDLTDVLLDHAHTSLEPPALARLRRQSVRSQPERGLER